MAVRNVIEIDEEKCNGCGKCVNACAEGAIKMVNGKARLVSDVYCDGLGACIGDCPVDALKVVQREAAEFDEVAVNEHLASLGRPALTEPVSAPTACPSVSAAPMAHGGGCPGSMARSLTASVTAETSDEGERPSHLANWPLQLHLVSPMAPYFKNAHLKVVADCVPFAMNGFHEQLLKGDPVVIACPKLDETGSYVDKLAQIIAQNDPTAITVAHMEVPCCTGIQMMVEKARELSGIQVTIHDVVVSIGGEILSQRDI